MREITPKEGNLANILMDILCMSKEAIYRRLRGEVAFTFSEVAIIASQLGISLDKIIGNSMSSGAMFDLNVLHSLEPVDNYSEILARYQKLFRYVKADSTSEVITASNTLPYTFYAPYEHLSKFRICRWLYQNERLRTPTSLSGIVLSEKLMKIQKELIEDLRTVKRTCFILDENVFGSFVKEIKYFAELGLVSTSDVANMKKELLQLLHELEVLSEKGSFHNGNLLSIYLSNVNFEATYTYVEKVGFQICFLRVYSINSMDSRDGKICNYQKKWIHSLKRHSTLISQSGEIQRMMFFNEQRKIVDML
ncbi:hypothetical protein DWW52_04880 [Odoribacter sp. AF15-53]|nr:hypothetical protein DWW52_04880 [Odoribacter sp. AF15-53]